MKYLSLLIVLPFSFFISALALSAETVVEVTGTGIQKQSVELQVANSILANTIKKNLEISGLFVVADKGLIKVTDSSGMLSAIGPVKSCSASLAFTDDKSARMAARQFADRMCETFCGQKGFATDRILFLNRGRQQIKGAAIPAELCMCYPDGGDIRQLTNDGAMIIFQRWMAEDDKILYISDLKGSTRIWELDVATGKRQVKWSFKGTPTGVSVSPDGRRVAMILSFQGNPELYVIDIATNKWTRLTNTQYDVEGQPTWSPNGREIAFVRGVNSQQIWVIDVATKRERRLTSKGRKNVDPDWGVDGRIAYLSGKELFVMNSESGDKHAFAVAAAANWEHPSWSRNGRHLAASRDKALFLIDTAEGGDKPRQVFFANGNWTAPSWRK